MSEYAPLRDAFHEINKLLIDKQQWDAEHEQRKSDQGLKRMLTESQLKDHALQRTKLELDAKENELKMRPTEVNIHDIIPNNGSTQELLYEKDPNLQLNLAKIWGGETIDRTTGKVLGSDGKPIMIPAFEKWRKSIGAEALLVGAFDSDTMLAANIGAIDKGIAEREAKIKGLENNPVGAKEAGTLRGEIARLKAQKGEHLHMRDDPDARIALLQKQLGVANTSAAQAVTEGASSDLVKLFLNQQDNITKQIVTWQTHKFDKAKDKDGNRVPQLTEAVFVDPNDPSKILKTVKIGVPKMTKGMLPEHLDKDLAGYVWKNQADFNKPPVTHKEVVQKINESVVKKDLSLKYGRVSEDGMKVLIFPDEAFAAHMADTILSASLKELRENEKTDWNKVSHADLVATAYRHQKALLDGYHQQQAAIRSLVDANTKLKTQEAKQKKFEEEMKELDKAMLQDYGAKPNLSTNPHIKGTAAFNKLTNENKIAQRNY